MQQRDTMRHACWQCKHRILSHRRLWDRCRRARSEAIVQWRHLAKALLFCFEVLRSCSSGRRRVMCSGYCWDLFARQLRRHTSYNHYHIINIKIITRGASVAHLIRCWNWTGPWPIKLARGRWQFLAALWPHRGGSQHREPQKFLFQYFWKSDLVTK